MPTTGATKFQFHKVRLKVYRTTHDKPERTFQFHKVRLKDRLTAYSRPAL